MKLKSLLEKRKSERLLFLVAGGSCAGKTTFARNMEQYIISNKMKSLVINQDDCLAANGESLAGMFVVNGRMPIRQAIGELSAVGRL
ncbi:MAG: hypothetical protein F6K30_15520 [Cyanothece sp. SIO2G6]|nr:hypothetical protein [Cyanothece sp. SIO2G6]